MAADDGARHAAMCFSRSCVDFGSIFLFPAKRLELHWSNHDVALIKVERC